MTSAALFAGRYLRIRQLGRGGMGEVWLMRDRVTGAECALKLLPAHHAPEAQRSLRAEFEALARVRHPALVRIDALELDLDGTPFLTMEYVPGLPADQAITRGDWGAIAHVGARVARALDALHRAGVVHGDIKPSNVLVVAGEEDAPPQVRVVDLGLATLEHGGDTVTGGTVGYAAPELLADGAPSAASDLYALGVTLWTLALGPLELIDGEPQCDTAALTQAGAPAALKRVLAQLVARTASQRPAGADEVAQVLEALDPFARRGLSERLANARFVGYERELARVAAARRSGRGRAFIVTAPAGGGRSAFLTAAATRATLDRQVVWQLHPLGRNDGAVAQQLLRFADAVIGSTFADAPEAFALPDALGHLQNALQTLAARGTPVCITIDDFAHCDDASAAFVRHAIAQMPQVAATWLLSQPPALVDEEPLLLTRVARELALPPLDAATLSELVADRIGEPAPAGLLEWVAACSGGVPGVAVRALYAAAEAKALVASDNGVRFDAARAPVSLPGGGDDALERALATKADARRALVRIAAAGGATDAARLHAWKVDGAALATLVRAGLLLRDGSGGAAIQPPSLAPQILEAIATDERTEALRAALASATTDRERFELHAALAEHDKALELAEALWVRAVDVALARRAARCADAAGDPERRVLWHLRAALEAREARDPRTAALEARAALDAGAHERERTVARRVLLRALVVGNDVSEAERANEEFLASDPSAEDRAHGAAVELLTRFLRRQPVTEAQVHAAYQQALATNDADTIVSCAEVILYIASTERSIASTLEIGADVQRWCEHASSRLSVARILYLHSYQLQERGRPDLAIEPLEAALERNSDPSHAGVNLLLEDARCSCLGELCEWRAARAANASILRRSQQLKIRGHIDSRIDVIAMLDSLMGEPRRALRLLRESAAVAGKADVDLKLLPTWVRGRSLRAIGRADHARRVLERGLRDTGTRITGGTDRWLRVELAALLCERGEWSAARKVLEPIEDDAPPTNPVLIAIALRGRCALRQCEGLEGAEKALHTALERRVGRPRLYVDAHLHWLAAEIAIAREADDDAIARAKDALEAFAKLPAPLEEGSAALALAVLALQRGHVSPLPIGDWLQTAREAFDRLGNTPMRLRVLQREVEWLRQTRDAAGPSENGADLLETVKGLLDSLPAPRELAQRVLRLAIEHLGAERGVFLMRNAASGELEPLAEQGPVDSDLRGSAVHYSRTIVERVLQGGESVVFLRDSAASASVVTPSLQQLRVRSAVAVPLRAAGQVLGVLYLSETRARSRFSESKRAQLEALAQLITTAVARSLDHGKVEMENARLLGENASLTLALEHQAPQDPDDPIVGTHESTRQLRLVIGQFARSTNPVLITGESGTGKELVAAELHRRSDRAKGRFIATNCAAQPEALLEAELFGIHQNVATGVHARPGLFELASGGTLFLDEVGDMSPRMQAALLRVLEARAVTRVGIDKPMPIDVRIVAATNVDLQAAMLEGRFRPDLFYRLDVLQLKLAPLRERRADIPLLIEHFVSTICDRTGRDRPAITREFRETLLQSEWRGNVRELRNYIERLLAMTPEGEPLVADPLPTDLARRVRAGVPLVRDGLDAALKTYERQIIQRALREADGNQSAAARALKIGEQKLRYRLRVLGDTEPRKNLRVRKNPRKGDSMQDS